MDDPLAPSDMVRALHGAGRSRSIVQGGQYGRQTGAAKRATEAAGLGLGFATAAKLRTRGERRPHRAAPRTLAICAL